MTAFDAATAVLPLDFDLTAVGGPKGVVPEPTAEQVNAYRRHLRTVVRRVTGLQAELAGNEDADEVEHRVEEERRRMDEADLRALAALCSDQPSYEELAALPLRHQQAFSGWVIGSLKAGD